MRRITAFVSLCVRRLPVLLAILLSLVTGYSAEPAPRESTESSLSNQWKGASRVVEWRRETRELWQHADALEQEAIVLSQLDPEQTKAAVDNKLAMARELRAAGDAPAEQASRLQQWLPMWMIQ